MNYCLITCDFDKTLVWIDGCQVIEFDDAYDFRNFSKYIDLNKSKLNQSLVEKIEGLYSSYPEENFSSHIVTNRSKFEPIFDYLAKNKIIHLFARVHLNPIKSQRINKKIYRALSETPWKGEEILDLVRSQLDTLKENERLEFWAFDDDQRVLDYVKDRLPNNSNLIVNIINISNFWS